MNRIRQILVSFISPFSLRSVPIGYATFGDAVQFEDYRGNVYRSMQLTLNFCSRILPIFLQNRRGIQECDYPDENKVLVEQVKEMPVRG